MRLHPRRGWLGRAVAADEIDVLLLQALLGALVVVEHRRVEVELDQVADLAECSLGVADEILEVDLVVVLDLRCHTAGLGDPLDPERGRLLVGLRPPVHPHVGEGDVAPVADDVDEARLGESALDPDHLLDVAGRLVAVARLALALGVFEVEGADHVGGVRLRDRCDALPKCVRVQVEVLPALRIDDDFGQLGGGHPVLLDAADQLGHPVRLARDRELGV